MDQSSIDPICIIDPEDEEIFLGKKKITKEDRENIERIGDFEI